MSIKTATDQPFGSLARQANKLMDQLQKGFYAYSNESWTPNVNLYETGDAYLVCVDLSGVDKDKIDVEVQDQRLRLCGARTVPRFDEVLESGGDASAREGGGCSEAGGTDPVRRAEPAAAARLRVHLMEIDHGPFAREVELPADANREHISATYRNGLLWIEIPKGE